MLTTIIGLEPEGHPVSVKKKLDRLYLNQDLIIGQLGPVISDYFVDTCLNSGCSIGQVQEMMRQIVEEEAEARRMIREARVL